MKDNKKVLRLDKSKVKLDMSFDAKDVIDILVSEQEQNIENIIANFEMDLQKETTKLTDIEKQFQTEIRAFVKVKYLEKIELIEQALTSIGANSAVKYEIIEGSAMHTRRQKLVSSNRELTDDDVDNDEKIIVALIVCNKDFTRDTVDNAVSFYLETEFDEKLKSLNKQKQDITTIITNIRKEINNYKDKLKNADKLIRRARAAVTKKVIGNDISELINDFREQFPQVELKKLEQQ